MSINMMDLSMDEALIQHRPVTVLSYWLIQIYPHYVRGRSFSLIPYQHRETYLHGIDYCHFEACDEAYCQQYIG